MFVFFALYLPLFLYCITTCIFHIYKSFKDEKIYRNINIGGAIAFGLLSVFVSVYIIYNYADEMKTDICPNCNYTYQLSNNYTYCPQCNTKLKNKCDNCNRIIPDEATETCPYCGEAIKTKVEEIPESKKYSDENQQYSKCPNCEKSLKDMKDIDNCPYCGFELTHITNKLTECQYCHRSLDGMEHIGDKCPYCGNKIN